MIKYFILYFILCIWFGVDRMIEMEVRKLGGNQQLFIRLIVFIVFMAFYFLRNRIISSISLLFRRRRE